MKKALLASAVGCLLSVSSAHATTVFSPALNTDITFENVNYLNIGINPADYQVAMFDYIDTDFTYALAINSGDQVSFNPGTPGPGPFTATNTNTGQAITVTTTAPLPGTPSFFLALKDLNSGVWYNDVSATMVGTNIWSIAFENGVGTTVQIDTVISAVPLPAAVWLFSAGLIGFAGIARSHTRAS